MPPSAVTTPKTALQEPLTGLFTPLSQSGLFALSICTAPLRAVASTPLWAESGGSLRMTGPLGSIDSNEPSCLTPAASGAPKFDRLATRILFGSSSAPGWNRLGIGWAHAGGTG